MKRGGLSQGFTVIEVMIFLAVSGGLLVSAMLVISGQQLRTQFSQSVNDARAQVEQVINNVSTGYYARTVNFNCLAGATPQLNFAGPFSQQGENRGCIFLGRVMQFGVSGTDSSGVNVYNLVGLQNDASGNEVGTLAAARPIALAPSSANPSYPAATIESGSLQYGLKAVRMKYSTVVGTPPTIPTGAAGFVTDFAQISVSGGLTSSSRRGDLYAINGTALNRTAIDTVDRINTLAAANFVKAATVAVCLDIGTQEYGILTMGGNNRQLSSTLNIVAKSSNPTECI